MGFVFLDVLELVQSCPDLEELDLSDALNLTEYTIHTIQDSLKSLRRLSLNRCYNMAQSHLSQLRSLPNLEMLNVIGMLQAEPLEALRQALAGITLNNMPFSSVARPTVGPHVRSIWGQKVWKNIKTSS